MIALSGFKDIKVSENEKSVEAGSGLNWYELYAAIEPHGIMVVGGRLKTIGVGGLTLGGGISYFTSKYGFTMVRLHPSLTALPIEHILIIEASSG